MTKFEAIEANLHDIDKRLTVIEKDLKGNGRGGLFQMLEDLTELFTKYMNGGRKATCYYLTSKEKRSAIIFRVLREIGILFSVAFIIYRTVISS